MKMTSQGKGKATCDKWGLSNYKWRKSFMYYIFYIKKKSNDKKKEGVRFYQIETQAWIIHWIITNAAVHNTKYANLNTGNLCMFRSK